MANAYRKNQYEFKDNYIILRIFHPSYTLKTFIDYEDYNLVKKYHWYSVKSRTVSTLYLQARDGKNKYYLHRLITNAPKGLQVDHINHNTLNNRKANLHICTQQENLKNRRTKKGYGTTDILNISIQTSFYKDKVYKYYKVNKKGYKIKTFTTLEQALKYKEECI